MDAVVYEFMYVVTLLLFEAGEWSSYLLAGGVGVGVWVWLGGEGFSWVVAGSAATVSSLGVLAWRVSAAAG
jgi:hypothetical protein